jgi:hypothetical protein
VLVSSESHVVARLRSRQQEIEQAIFATVREMVPDLGAAADEYVRGLRTAVAAAVEFGFTGLALGEGCSLQIPVEVVAQARLAARSGVSLDAILRRYIVGHSLLWDYVMVEADRVTQMGMDSGLREMSRVQTSLLDQLVIGVTREHVAELERAGRSREHRLLERIRLLLSSARTATLEETVPTLLDLDSDYDLSGEHLGVIAQGACAREALQELAERLDRRLLSVTPSTGTLWAWLGGRSVVGAADIAALVGARAGRAEGPQGRTGGLAGEVSLAIGEPARGLEGWRATHRQAQVALLVARRQPRQLTRYADVALLAAALQDDLLAASLLEVYSSPLDDARGSGTALRETLRAYFAAEHNVSATASALNLDRGTVHNRVRESERRLGFRLHERQAELEVALRLEKLHDRSTPKYPPAPSLD